MGDGIVVRIEGDAEVQAILNRMRGQARTDAAKVVTRRALLIQAALKRKLSQSGGGITYRRGGVVHTASAPGQPPAVDTGRLRNSVVPFISNGGLAAEIGTRLTPYPEWLEDGTPKGQMAPRPWIAPVWRTQEPLYMLDMAEAIRLLGR